MSDYISRADALAAFEKVEDLYDPEWGNKRYTPDDVEEIINDVPAADVRPVVYCRDCIHLGFKDFNGICNGPMFGIVKPWDYCSHGEMGGDT